jgi:uncharacterized membrane protein
MRFAIIYLSTLVVMLPLDFAFLGTIGKKVFSANVGDMVLDAPRLPPAVLFYVLYLAGVVIFVNGTAPANWTHSLLYGALFGLFAIRRSSSPTCRCSSIGNGRSSFPILHGERR